jgi:hypothetical protein
MCNHSPFNLTNTNETQITGFRIENSPNFWIITVKSDLLGPNWVLVGPIANLIIIIDGGQPQSGDGESVLEVSLTRGT